MPNSFPPLTRNPHKLRALNVLLMVHELHKIGYQRLRIVPGMSPSGSCWRCAVTHVGNIQRSHGALASKFGEDTACHTTANTTGYFQWEDVEGDTPRELAAKFLRRYPKIARLGKGEDWAYAGWYTLMLGFAEKGEFPVAYSDWYSKPDPRQLPTDKGFDSGLPMPPPGEGRDEDEYEDFNEEDEESEE